MQSFRNPQHTLRASCSILQQFQQLLELLHVSCDAVGIEVVDKELHRVHFSGSDVVKRHRMVAATIQTLKSK